MEGGAGGRSKKRCVELWKNDLIYHNNNNNNNNNNDNDNIIHPRQYLQH